MTSLSITQKYSPASVKCQVYDPQTLNLVTMIQLTWPVDSCKANSHLDNKSATLDVIYTLKKTIRTHQTFFLTGDLITYWFLWNWFRRMFSHFFLIMKSLNC